jgi:hypothetical protein
VVYNNQLKLGIQELMNQYPWIGEDADQWNDYQRVKLE